MSEISANENRANTERIAVQLLQHQLDLAVRLLRNARECRDGVDRETEVMEAAREAYRYSLEAARKLAPLSPKDQELIDNKAQEYRSALNALGQSKHAS